MEDELTSMERHNVWELTNYQQIEKLLKIKWVFHIKRNKEGEIGN